MPVYPFAYDLAEDESPLEGGIGEDATRADCVDLLDAETVSTRLGTVTVPSLLIQALAH
ncbi:hypothetical protein B0I33_102225 [Prauserella shujinwangii]|uniref:Uncharacterized protein n=2 Tax=Prauserella shujinwangii TaxID=1453103 RepID=A0A2T0M0M0_9PSEU|nr:hypothetical protein B0I33_102225 [Prauserella shujinwangii]